MMDAIRRMSPLFLVVLLLPTSAAAQQTFPKEVYQDFRGMNPLLAEFRLDGPDHDAVTKSEAAGLRITLPKTRKVNQPVQVRANFDITGDFEITGAYEILDADAPTDGYGVGVSLNIATTNDLKTFLKMSRVMRPDKGSVYMAEYWTKGANDWRGPQELTDVRRGQLRLVREGARARCQVADEPGKPFHTIFEKDDFSTDDIVHLRFQVTDGNKPGYAVDARLIDLRIRHGRTAAKADAPIQPKNVVAPTDRKAEFGGGWLVLTLGLCLAMTLAVLGAVGLLLFVRRNRETRVAAPPAEVVAFACQSCGKSLKTKAASAGKKNQMPEVRHDGGCSAPG